MDDINSLVNRLLRGSKLVIANPATIDKLRQGGERIREIPKVSLEESIEKLFAHRKQNALQAAKELPGCPSWDAPILYLYDEIRQCILFGLNGTAISLSGMLVKFILKYVTYVLEQGAADFDSEAWKEFESKLTLRPAIKRAKKARLLDDKMTEKLHQFAQSIRNTYSHFNIQKITEGVVFKDVVDRNIETGEEVVRDMMASESPTLQIIAKANLDEQNVFKVFDFADRVVRHLLSQLELKHS